MPSVTYTRGEERLVIDWAVHGRADGPYDTVESWVDDRGRRAAVEALAGQVPSGSYGLIVTMTRDHFYE